LFGAAPAALGKCRYVERSRMLTRRFLISTTAVLASLPAAARAQEVAAVVGASSPDGVLSVSVTVTGEGRPEYSVNRLGRPVIAPSRLGFLLTDAAKLERNFAVTADAPTSHDDTWEQPWGERRFIRNRYTQLRVHLTEKWGLQRRIDVVFRLYDDGIGFRPTEVLQDKLGHLGIRGIRIRVKKLKGQLTIESAPGEGTSIRIVVPLVAQQTVSHNADARCSK